MMGYLRHECMVVSSDDATAIAKAHVVACSIFNEIGMGSLVSGLVQAVVNGGGAFMVAPDGSKEGWAQSDSASEARAKVITELRLMSVDWVHVLIGGDDGEYAIIASSNSK